MDSLGDQVDTIPQAILDLYDELHDSLDDYDDDDYSYDDPVAKNGEFELKICFASVVKIGQAFLLGLYLIAAFIYCHTFTKSLRVYLQMKCFWVMVINVSNITMNQLVYDSSKKGFFNGDLFKYRAYFEKVVTCGNFFVCNLNFLFVYDIYSMICSSTSFSKSLLMKLILLFLFSILPTASTFRYHINKDKSDSEAFGIEITYRFIIFLFICFFIHKVKKAFIKSANLRTNGQNEAAAAPPKTSADQSKHQRIFIFLIIMAIIHVFSMIPRIYHFGIDVKVHAVNRGCRLFTEECLASVEHLTCISFAKDIIAIIVSFLDILPFFIFLKREKMKDMVPCNKG